MEFVTRKVLPTGQLPYEEAYRPVYNENRFLDKDKWEYISDRNAREYLKPVEGQHENSQFGHEIYLLAQNEYGPKKWLEIGTWNGNGTTKCVLKGMFERESKEGLQFITYEADPLLYEIAKENLEGHPYYETILKLVYGRLPCGKEFLLETAIPESEKMRGGHFHLSFEYEKKFYEMAPQIMPPFFPEGVILDGGEYTGIYDWEALPKENLEFVLLDDICVFKNRSVYKELKESKEWELFKENKTSGNGWAIFRRRS